MALLYFQQKPESGGTAPPCAHGVGGGDNALTVGCPFWGRFLPGRGSECPTESEHAEKASHQRHQTVQSKGGA